MDKPVSTLMLFSGLFSSLAATLQAVAFAVHLKYLDVMRQAIEERISNGGGFTSLIRTHEEIDEMTVFRMS